MAQRTSRAGTTRSRSAPARPGSRVSAAAKKPAKKPVTKTVSAPGKKLAAKAGAKKAAVKQGGRQEDASEVTDCEEGTHKKATAKKAPAKKASGQEGASEEGGRQEDAGEEGCREEGGREEGSGEEGGQPRRLRRRRRPAKKAPAKKAAAKKAPDAKPAETPEATVAPPVKRTTPLKTAATSAPRPTRRGRKPLTPAERDEMKGVLRAEKTRLQHEIASAVEDLNELLRDSGDGSGDDQADAGSKTFEREHEMSVANNSRDLLVQVEHALQRIKDWHLWHLRKLRAANRQDAARGVSARDTLRRLQAAPGAALSEPSDSEQADGSESPGSTHGARRSRRPLWVVLGVAAGVLALDQVSKWWVQQVMPGRPPIEVVGEWLQITYARNPGCRVQPRRQFHDRLVGRRDHGGHRHRAHGLTSWLDRVGHRVSGASSVGR